MSNFKFCPKCGDRFVTKFRGGRDRLVCKGCGFVFYRNPIVGVAVVVFDEKSRVLLGRRSSSTYAGVWTFPSGHLEWGEDVRDAARRECLEETGLEVEIGEVYAVHSNFHNPESLTVGIWFRAEVTGGRLQAGDDLDRAEYFSMEALPEPIFFPTDHLVIAQIREDLATQD